MQPAMTSMTSVVWGRLFETVYGDFRDFHGLAELGRPFLEMRDGTPGTPPTRRNAEQNLRDGSKATSRRPCRYK